MTGEARGGGYSSGGYGDDSYGYGSNHGHGVSTVSYSWEKETSVTLIFSFYPIIYC